jgi:hypothetical protein
VRRKVSLRAVAFHEAGHAVIAILFGFPLVGGGVLPFVADEGPRAHWQGTVEYNPVAKDELDPVARLGSLHAQLVVTKAGHVAQRLGVPFSRRGSTGDDEIAGQLVTAAYESKSARTAALRLAREEAETLLRRHWPLVVAVADRFLAAPGLLSQSEILAAVMASRLDAVAAPAPRRRMPDPSRPARRADAAAAALLVLTRLVAEEPQLAARLSADMARAIEFTALRRDLDPQALRAKWYRVVDQEVALRAWQPVGQRRAVGGVGRFEG